MKVLVHRIYDAVRCGELAEPLTAAMVKRACPGLKENTYNSFLSITPKAIRTPTRSNSFAQGGGWYRLKSDEATC
jgi:hypothetical protein